MEKRYYIANENGKSMDAIREWQRLSRESEEKALQLADELKAKNVRYDHNGSLIDFEYEEHPGVGWIPARDREPKYYRPDRRTKTGKALIEKMKAIQIPTATTFADLIGGGHFVFSGNMWGRISYEKTGDKYVISVPIPGQVGSEPAREEFIPPDCVCIKKSEYLAMQGL